MQGYFDRMRHEHFVESLGDLSYQLLSDSSTPSKLTDYLLRATDRLGMNKEREEILEGIERGKKFLRAKESLVRLDAQRV